VTTFLFLFQLGRNKEWFALPLEYVYGLYANVLETTIKKYQIQCQGFVLMSNHFHMLVSTPKANLSQAMRYFMTESSRGIAKACKRINGIYGSRYHWTRIRESQHYAHAYLYLYRNPVKAKIVEKVEAYRFHTLHPWHRKFRSLILADSHGFDEHIPKIREEQLDWLNQEEDEAYSDHVRRALRKTEFSF